MSLVRTLRSLWMAGPPPPPPTQRPLGSPSGPSFTPVLQDPRGLGGGVFTCYHSPGERKGLYSPQPRMSPEFGTAFPQPSLPSSLSRVQGNSFPVRVGLCAEGCSALGTLLEKWSVREEESATPGSSCPSTDGAAIASMFRSRGRSAPPEGRSSEADQGHPGGTCTFSSEVLVPTATPGQRTPSALPGVCTLPQNTATGMIEALQTTGPDW